MLEYLLYPIGYLFTLDNHFKREASPFSSQLWIDSHITIIFGWTLIVLVNINILFLINYKIH